MEGLGHAEGSGEESAELGVVDLRHGGVRQPKRSPARAELRVAGLAPGVLSASGASAATYSSKVIEAVTMARTLSYCVG